MACRFDAGASPRHGAFAVAHLVLALASDLIRGDHSSLLVRCRQRSAGHGNSVAARTPGGTQWRGGALWGGRRPSGWIS